MHSSVAARDMSSESQLAATMKLRFKTRDDFIHVTRRKFLLALTPVTQQFAREQIAYPRMHRDGQRKGQPVLADLALIIQNGVEEDERGGETSSGSRRRQPTTVCLSDGEGTRSYVFLFLSTTFASSTTVPTTVVL